MIYKHLKAALVAGVLTSNVLGQTYQGPPDPADAVIYEIDLRHFSKEGTLNGVTKGLDGIKELGANVIYLMPIYPIGELQATDSPYAIRDYTAVNGRLGTMDDLRALVRAAHEKNIAVILDWVANHTAFDHPWLANSNWYVRDGANKAISPPNTGWNDVAQLNYKSMAMQTAMTKAMQHWVMNAGIDGFRCDYADGPSIQFWRAAIASVRSEAKRDLFFLAESGTRELHAAGFDCISGFDFYNILMQVHREGRSVKDLAAVGLKDRQNVANPKREARYISNHDVMGTDGPATQALGGEKGALAAFVVACTQGPPIIYASQEGLPGKSEGVHPADYTSGNINQDYKKILTVRKSSNALKRGRPTSYGNDDVYVVRMDHETERVLVVCNLRNRKATYSVPDFLATVPWVDIFSKQKKTLGRTIELEPFDYLILQAGRN